MKTILFKTKTVCLTVVLLSLLGPAVHAADIVYMTTFTNTTRLPCPPACYNPLELTGVSISLSGSTAISSPPGVPTRVRCTWGYAGDVNWSLKPTLAVAGATYRIEVAHTAASTSTNVLVTAWSTNGVVSASCTNSPVFDREHGGNAWVTMGTITLDPGVTEPVITFLKTGGVVDNIAASGGPNRLYIDAFKFTEIDPCDGVVADPVINGPLAADKMFVNVSGITEGATTVTVYANSVEIGQTNYAPGFSAGTVQVPTTSPLVASSEVTARQSKAGCTSGLSSIAIVGGGANPVVKVSLGLAQNTTFTGPAGADSTGAGTINYWLSATALVEGSASAPVGGKVLTPDSCWYNVTFQWGVDPALNWLTGAAVTESNPFAALDSITFAIDGDSGPYDIYIDDIRNGDVVIENFEGHPDGTPNVMFENPNYAATPNPVSTYLQSPNSSTISQAHAAEGANSCRIQWQFANKLSARWARVVAAGATAGKKYPQLDTTKPVTMKILVLPVGTTSSHSFVGTVSNIAGTNAAFLGLTNSFSVSVTGPGSYTYTWFKDGFDQGVNAPSLTIGDADGGLQAHHAGIYTLAVSDGTCSERRSIAFTVMNPAPVITNQPRSAVVPVGSTAPVTFGEATSPSPLGNSFTYIWTFNGEYIAQFNNALEFPAGAQATDSGAYQLVVDNGYGSATSQVAVVSVLPAGITPGTGTGLTAYYYTLHTNNAPFTGAPTLTYVEPEINFNWGTGSPDATISGDYFTARWFGDVQALGTGDYTFYTLSDDGVRLWVNGQLVIDEWNNHAPRTNSATINLTGSQKYRVIMEYYENGGSAAARLWWSNSFTPLLEGPIPGSQLYPLTFVAPTVALTAPANPTSVTLPATVNMTATVTANSGLVDKVQFLADGTLVGESLTEPYGYSWVNPPAGTHSIVAKVVYNVSSSSESAAATLNVTAQALDPVTGVTIAVDSGDATISYTGGTGSQFVLLSTEAIEVPNWTRIATNTVTPSSFTVPTGSAARTFYKIQSE